jgi:FixJ family two-component response regulator
MPVDGTVVAIIDDDEAVREGLERLLAARGYETEVYASAEEFIAAAKASKAACLVLDIQLGDISGVELARHLSSIGLTFPIIFMTGSQSEEIRKQALEFGCIAFLIKPFRCEPLFDAVRKALV